MCAGPAYGYLAARARSECRPREARPRVGRPDPPRSLRSRVAPSRRSPGEPRAGATAHSERRPPDQGGASRVLPVRPSSSASEASSAAPDRRDSARPGSGTADPTGQRRAGGPPNLRPRGSAGHSRDRDCPSRSQIDHFSCGGLRSLRRRFACTGRLLGLLRPFPTEWRRRESNPRNVPPTPN